MATIVPVGEGAGQVYDPNRLAIGKALRLRSVTAQASTGQTDWVRVPPAAKFVEVLVNVTATGGTTPICLPSVLAADPIALSDTNTAPVGTATTTGITGTGLARIVVGPGVSGIADQVAVGTSGGADVKLNSVLPALLGIKVLNDRTTGDETYTYTVTVTFRA
jgi:hypothetical protein